MTFAGGGGFLSREDSTPRAPTSKELEAFGCFSSCLFAERGEEGDLGVQKGMPNHFF
jgi:hypothetical protein